MGPYVFLWVAVGLYRVSMGFLYDPMDSYGSLRVSMGSLWVSMGSL